MKNILCVLLLSIILCSCSPVKNILQAGSLKQTDFVEKIPFNFDNGVPVIQVSIGGKSYNFLLDTGAPTVLSTELAAILNLKAQTNSTTADSQGNKNKEELVVIPNIQIGKLSFENTGALVMDIHKVFEMRCLKFDGIIGANQMAKAIWQLDYKNRLVTISNDLSNFTIAENTAVVDFSPKKIQNTPLVPIKIGNKTTLVTFDTGSNGSLYLGASGYKEVIKDFKSIQSYGSTSAGLYGGRKDLTNIHSKVPALEMGPVVLKDQVFEFRENGSSILGNRFLKNYKVVIDWNTHKIYMTKESEFDETKLKRFGFNVKFVNNKPVVGAIYKNSDAEKAGLLLSEEIVDIDGTDLSNLTEDEACSYAFKSITAGKDTAKVTILRAGKKVEFNLRSSILLE
ncbi:aspartyl protease family protein [Pedobacter metabolipauper]|uniref:Aspartyl protease n=1 Tax=Pedobacter metabolipauper TaxID=425513 RepID=A0A4R6STW7_9SPHI|nr:aspartyl protease family protein [Pedobacter metabolipauper]TDQ08915.1 aspartyl protease [Pedobacter metabolipauper]